MKIKESVMCNLYTSEFFTDYDSAYFGMSTQINDKIYFALCSHTVNSSAGVFNFDLNSKEIIREFTLDHIFEPEIESIKHGKIHTNLFFGLDEKLYFGTHFAYPDCLPQNVNYEGGRILSYDPFTKEVENYGVIMEGEGIVTMVLDEVTMHCYILTSPSFYFIDYNLSEREICYLKQIDKSSSICRSLALDNKGNVYGSCEPYQVFKYNRLDRELQFLNTNFEKISVKKKEWISPKKEGANRVGRTLWRCVNFDQYSNSLYGISACDSSLFRFNISTNEFVTLNNENNIFASDRIYPSLAFAYYNKNYYYLPSNGRFDYKLSEDIQSTSSLIALDSELDEVRDYGLVYGPNQELIYGSSSAMCTLDGRLLMIGAVQTQNENKKDLGFDGNCYFLSIIEINLNTITT